MNFLGGPSILRKELSNTGGSAVASSGEIAASPPDKQFQTSWTASMAFRNKKLWSSNTCLPLNMIVAGDKKDNKLQSQLENDQTDSNQVKENDQLLQVKKSRRNRCSIETCEKIISQRFNIAKRERQDGSLNNNNNNNQTSPILAQGLSLVDVKPNNLLDEAADLGVVASNSIDYSRFVLKEGGRKMPSQSQLLFDQLRKKATANHTFDPKTASVPLSATNGHSMFQNTNSFGSQNFFFPTNNEKANLTFASSTHHLDGVSPGTDSSSPQVNHFLINHSGSKSIQDPVLMKAASSKELTNNKNNHNNSNTCQQYYSPQFGQRKQLNVGSHSSFLIPSSDQQNIEVILPKPKSRKSKYVNLGNQEHGQSSMNQNGIQGYVLTTGQISRERFNSTGMHGRFERQAISLKTGFNRKSYDRSKQQLIQFFPNSNGTRKSHQQGSSNLPVSQILSRSSIFQQNSSGDHSPSLNQLQSFQLQLSQKQKLQIQLPHISSTLTLKPIDNQSQDDTPSSINNGKSFLQGNALSTTHSSTNINNNTKTSEKANLEQKLQILDNDHLHGNQRKISYAKNIHNNSSPKKIIRQSLNIPRESNSLRRTRNSEVNNCQRMGINFEEEDIQTSLFQRTSEFITQKNIIKQTFENNKFFDGASSSNDDDSPLDCKKNKKGQNNSNCSGFLRFSQKITNKLSQSSSNDTLQLVYSPQNGNQSSQYQMKASFVHRPEEISQTMIEEQQQQLEQQQQQQYQADQQQLQKIKEMILKCFQSGHFKQYSSELKDVVFRSTFFEDLITKMLIPDEQQISLKKTHLSKHSFVRFSFVKEQLKTLGITPLKMDCIVKEIEFCLKESNEDIGFCEETMKNLNIYLDKNLHWTLLDYLGNENDLRELSMELLSDLESDILSSRLLSYFSINSDNIFELAYSVFQKENIDQVALTNISNIATQLQKNSSTSNSNASTDVTYADLFYVKYRIMYFCLEKNISRRIIFAVIEVLDKIQAVVLQNTTSAAAAAQFIDSSDLSSYFRKAISSNSKIMNIFNEKNLPLGKMEYALQSLARGIVDRSMTFYPICRLPFGLGEIFRRCPDLFKIFSEKLLETLENSKCDKHVIADTNLILSTIKIAVGLKQSFNDQLLISPAAAGGGQTLETLLQILLGSFEENQVFKMFTQLSDGINMRIFSLNLLCYLFDIFADTQPCRIFTLDIQAQFKMFGCNQASFRDFIIQVERLFAPFFQPSFFENFLESSFEKIKNLDIPQ